MAMKHFVRWSFNIMLKKSLSRINSVYFDLQCLPCMMQLCDNSSHSVEAFKLCGNDKATVVFPVRVKGGLSRKE